jgi:GT2 family glycosyltransferase
VTPPMTSPIVSVVCLSYNRPHLLADALAGLRAQTYPALDVTVIDNRSLRSAEVAAVAARFPEFRFVANLHNTGFSGGMNLGIRQATGEFVCLTEDDLVLEPGFVQTLVEYFTAHPDTGLAGGLLLNRDVGTVLCAGADYDLGPVFRFRFRAEGVPDGEGPAGPVATPFVSGSVVFARRDFLADQLNGFREDFFVYLEDLDLSLRTQRAGRPIVIVPAARAHHAEPPAGPPSDFVEFHRLKNLYSVYLLHARAYILPLFVLRYGPWAVLKSLLRGRKRDARLIARAWAYVLPRFARFWKERGALRSRTG